MWIVLGTGVNSGPVEGGLQVERHCEACGCTSVFHEHAVRESLRLYFVDVFSFSEKRVLRCSSCGTAVLTDELPSSSGRPTSQDGTLAGRAGSFVKAASQGRLPEAIPTEKLQTVAEDVSSGARVLSSKVEEAAKGALDESKRQLRKALFKGLKR